MLRILKIISENLQDYFMQKFWEIFWKFSKIISEHFELNFEKFCKVFRKFAWRNVHSSGSCKVPFLQAKGCFSRNHSWFVYIQFLITISSPFTPWSKTVVYTNFFSESSKINETLCTMLRIMGVRLRDRVNVLEIHNETKTKNLANFIEKLKICGAWC